MLNAFASGLPRAGPGTMGYLKRKAENGQLLRERAAVPFPWARSALVCFASYAFPDAPLSTETPERAERLDCAVCLDKPCIAQQNK